MKRCLWLLLLSWLLQAVGASAWSLPAGAASPAGCHATAQAPAAQDGEREGAHEAGSKHGAGLLKKAEGHHCCALGCTMCAPAPFLAPATDRADARAGPWSSLFLEPDLRPPIF